MRRFLLIDDDVLTIGNISRHELDWSAVGVSKVEAVQEALDLIAPDMDVIVRAHRLAGQESAMAAAAALKELGSCDLIIDATANSSVFLLAATVARDKRLPMCWGEVFAGGIGGLIARARPDMDPNPFAVRNAILKHCESLSDAPYKTANGYDIVGEEEPIVADDADVTQISSALTRLALDTALHKNPSGFPHPVYLIGLRSEWIFQQPFDTHPIAVEGVGWDEVGGIVTDTDREAALQAILSILAEQ